MGFSLKQKERLLRLIGKDKEETPIFWLILSQSESGVCGLSEYARRIVRIRGDVFIRLLKDIEFFLSFQDASDIGLIALLEKMEWLLSDDGVSVIPAVVEPINHKCT